MTPKEFADKLRKQLEEFKRVNAPFQLAVYTAVGRVSKRAFVEGKNTAGARFGYDNKTPLYVNPKLSPGKGFSPAGKPKTEGKVIETKVGVKTILSFKETTKRSKTKNVRLKTLGGIGKLNKQDLETRWFPSYKAYRQTIGRESNFVNWFLSGDLKSDYENSPKGSPPSAVKIDPNNYHSMVRAINSLKYEGLADKYGEFLTLNKEEEAQFYKDLEFETRKFFAL